MRGTRTSAIAAIFGAGVVVMSAAAVDAGVVTVTKAAGSINFGAISTVGVPNSRDFEANAGDSDTVYYYGQFGGTGQVEYDLSQSLVRDEIAVLTTSVRSYSDIDGPAPDSVSRFEMEFTNDEPIWYRFSSQLLGLTPERFTARLDNTVASAHIDSSGQMSGTMPVVEVVPNTFEFGQFVTDGILPPGTHQFTIEAFASDASAGEGATSGFATLEVAAVPLPPAVWAGLGLMLAIRIARPMQGRRAQA